MLIYWCAAGVANTIIELRAANSVTSHMCKTLHVWILHPCHIDITINQKIINYATVNQWRSAFAWGRLQNWFNTRVVKVAIRRTGINPSKGRLMCYMSLITNTWLFGEITIGNVDNIEIKSLTAYAQLSFTTKYLSCCV